MNSNQIATVASGIINLISTGQQIYKIAANAMDAIEQTPNMTGADKKAWVMAFVGAVAKDLDENWDVYAALISSFIDQIKTAYNAVKWLFN